MSATREKRLRLAEAVCQELRWQITARIAEQNWSPLMDLLHKWTRSAPKSIAYGRQQQTKTNETSTTT